IFFFGLSTISSAQDPRLFENDWYLYEVMSTDMNNIYEVAVISPPISPFLSISENLSFNGEGACNTFSGNYGYSSPDFLTPINFLATSEDCGIQQHDQFERDYFDFLGSFIWYNISSDSQGKTLSMFNALMGYAVFKSYPLSTS